MFFYLNSNRRNLFTLLGATMLMLVSVNAGHADPSKQQIVVDKAKLVIDTMATQKDMGQFRRLLAVSKGIVIIPQFLKASFIIGGAGGNGVLLTRNENAEWSSPVFYAMGEASIGLQIGAQAKELVLIIMTDKGMDAIIKNKIQLGAGVSAAVGPVGKDLGTSTTTNLDVDVFSFANNAGLFIGASVDGAYLSTKEEWNRSYYGQSLTVQDVVKERLVEQSEAAGLKKALSAAEAL